MFDIIQDFNEAVEVLEKRKLRYAVVGGIAVAIYGGVRSTTDADFLLHPDDVAQAVDGMKEKGFLETSDAWMFRASGLTLRRVWRLRPGKDDASVIDFLYGTDSRHLEILEKAETMPWARGTVRVARKEDIVWMKSLARRHKDLADIERLHEPDETNGNPS